MVQSTRFTIVFFIVVAAGCLETNDQVVAIINGRLIYQNEVDAKVVNELYRVRQNALELYIDERVLNLEALEKGVDKQLLLDSQVSKKISPVTEADISQYLGESNVTSTYRSQIKSRLERDREKFRYRVFLDSLSREYGVKIFMSIESHIRDVLEKEVYSHSIGSKSGLRLYFIGNYDCEFCFSSYENTFKIVQPFLNSLSFHFVYYGNMVDRKILFAEACANQNLFWAVNDDLHKISEINEDAINFIAFENSLNLLHLKRDISYELNKSRILRSISVLRDIGVSSTPTLILDGKILPGDIDSVQLSYLIEKKIMKRK